MFPESTAQISQCQKVILNGKWWKTELMSIDKDILHTLIFDYYIKLLWIF